MVTPASAPKHANLPSSKVPSGKRRPSKHLPPDYLASPGTAALGTWGSQQVKRSLTATSLHKVIQFNTSKLKLELISCSSSENNFSQFANMVSLGDAALSSLVNMVNLWSMWLVQLKYLTWSNMTLWFLFQNVSGQYNTVLRKNELTLCLVNMLKL